MNKNLLDLEEHLNSFEERSQKEIEDLQSKVDVANESREKLAEDYIIAREKLDTKSFTKISEEMRSLKDVVELYEDKIEQLKETPVVSKEEYVAMKDSILETLKSEDEKAQVKVFDSVKERDEYIAELAREFKIKRYAIAKRKKIFEQVFKKYFVTAGSRQKKINGRNRRQTQYTVINFKHIAEQRSKSTDEVIEVYRSYKYNK